MIADPSPLHDSMLGPSTLCTTQLSSSTNWQWVAPRDKASSPIEPVPAKRSSHRVPSRKEGLPPSNACSMSNSAFLTWHSMDCVYQTNHPSCVQARPLAISMSNAKPSSDRLQVQQFACGKLINRVQSQVSKQSRIWPIQSGFSVLLLLCKKAAAGSMLAGEYLLHHRPCGLPSPRQNPLPSLCAAHDAQPPVQFPFRISPPPRIHLREDTGLLMRIVWGLVSLGIPTTLDRSKP